MMNKSMFFINRVEELKILREILNSHKPELVIIYGRRRVGKTTILKKLKEEYRNDAIYFLADLTENILEILSRQIEDKFVRFSTWEDFFEYLYSCKEKIIFIDEFQYLYKVNKAFPTQLQRWWEKIKQKNKKIILCGSLISTIYKISLGYGSALYGRKTREVSITPMKFKDICEFFPNSNIEDIVKIYGILGGVPRYLEEFDESLTIEKNILTKILNNTSYLYNEPYNLFFEEFKNPSPYFSIIQSISQGKVKFNDIANNSYIMPHKLSKYLFILERIEIIEKITPITESKIKTKHTIYKIKDNFFKFWFRYIFPNRSLIEIGKEQEILEIILDDFNTYIGEVFEDIANQILMDLKVFDFTKIGKWWHKDKEIDIIAINEQTKELLAVEVKWQDIKLRDAKKIIEELHEKLPYVEWHNEERKEVLGIFAKSIDKKAREWLESNGYKGWDLRDVERVVKR